jgi:Papain-like cysteine protease AvrRpt2
MYIVPNMKLIKQTTKMGCWYASAQMLVQWKRNKNKATSMDLLDPSEDLASKKLMEVNAGMLNPEIKLFALRLGLKTIPPMSPSPSAIKSWLFSYGPLWVNGKTHIVVIAGIRNEDSATEVLVYDPWMNYTAAKSIEWRSLSQWYIGKDNSSRDTDAAVQAVFLYCPM